MTTPKNSSPARRALTYLGLVQTSRYGVRISGDLDRDVDELSRQVEALTRRVQELESGGAPDRS